MSNVEEFKLKSLSLTNFMSHSNTQIPLDKFTEIFGENSTGKTSILKALMFLIKGGKNDVEKIKIGEEKTIVEGVFEGTQGSPLVVKTSLDRSGNLICTTEFKGIKNRNPRSFIKKLLSVGSLNPRELLEKKDREQRLLSLFPMFLKKEEIVMPTYAKPFPIHDWDSINLNQHTFLALNDIYSDLKRTRESLFQKKDLLKKSFLEQKDTHEDKCLDFKRTYEMDYSSDEIMAYEKIFEQVGAFSAKKESIKKEIEKTETEVETLKNEIKTNKERIQNKNETIKINYQAIEGLKEQILKLENKIRVEKNEVEKLREDSVLNEKNIVSIEKDNKEKQDEYKSCCDIIIQMEQNKLQSSLARDLKNEKKYLETKKVDFEKAENQYLTIKNIAGPEFKKFKEKQLEPVVTKVPGISINEKGKIIWQKKSLDELSESEVVLLGIRFMNLDKKGRIIAVNAAECMSEKTIHGMENEFKNIDKNFLLIRVAETPLGEPWKSHSFKKQEEKNVT